MVGVQMLDGQLIEKQIPIVLKPDQINLYWSNIEAGLKDMLDMPGRDWTLESIYEELITGTSSCICVIDRWDGFIIYRIYGYPSICWIGIAYSANNNDIGYYWKYLIDSVRKAGITKIAFSSARTGWGRLAKRYGFKPVRIIYELEV
jgi:hypothetical protein